MAVTVQFELGMVPVYVVVPLPPQPVTEVRLEPVAGVTVQVYVAP